ncbi:hemerythrin domain-containing protein [Actinacidiphila rubida]|uniref:Hemerythrin HHE cation binding domain-containing protein n=1 Tax=Actinacidiphila rubida TaxID=310780 RepID=A0A1H8EFM4_9ACTN|nr:hemerythrin domain-containing protein [Actinacidiphila rubida]SEN18206.1 Hemerythrin HHE cation binding domain-containing protein [Actinacidiphila rubida]
MSTGTGYDTPSKIDFLMMYAAHDAFRRDLARLVAAADSTTGDLTAFRQGWATFERYLTIHHTAEDNSLWPPIRAKVGAVPERLALLDAMEAEHSVLDPLMASIDQQLAGGGTSRLRSTVEELGAALTAHLEHEETQGLPLVDAVLTEKEWNAFSQEQRRAVGFKGGAHFFPWVLDGAPPSVERRVLALVPPPVRFLYRRQWRPKYEKSSPWGPAARG